MDTLEFDKEPELRDPEMEVVANMKDALGQGGLRSVRFPACLEAAFDDYHHANTLKHVRVSLLTGLFLYAIFGLVDLQLPPESRIPIWFIRYAVVCPTVIAVFAFTYATGLKRFLQRALCLVMLAGSLGIITMVYFDPTPTKNYYYSGILLLIMGAFTFVSLRFGYAISWAVFTTIVYESVAVFARHTDPAILVQNTFSIFAAITIGSFSNRLMENYLRRDFLNAILLEHENKRLQLASEDLRRLSISDPLTGLGNRRQFESKVKQEWMRAMRTQTPIALIFFDIDSFKSYNDTYGHQAGDECLKQIAEVIGGFAHRAGDVSARFGGEEFVLLLPGTDLAKATAIAEECRIAVEALRLPHEHSSVSEVVTISAGVATMVPGMDTSSKVLITAADRCLYEAKKGGRNRVVPADPSVREASHLYLPESDRAAGRTGTVHQGE